MTLRLKPPGGDRSPFALPKGLLGRLAGWIMARTNMPNNEWAIAVLDVRPDDHVLEIGFGPGTAIQRLAGRARFVAGVDPSEVMVRQATARNRRAIEEGRVELRQGSVSALPYESGRFDKVLSVNSIMAWPDPARDLGEVYRVLKPGGRVAITVQPRWVRTEPAVMQIGDELRALLSQAGFVDVVVQLKRLKPPSVTAVGTKPAVEP